MTKVVNILDHPDIQYVYNLLKTEHYNQQFKKEENYGTGMGREKSTNQGISQNCHAGIMSIQEHL